MPTSRRARTSGGCPRVDGSRRATSARARSASSRSVTVSRATRASSSSTPRRRSSIPSAPRAHPRSRCRAVTSETATAASSTSPTAVSRPSTRWATSSGTPRRASARASSARVWARRVSNRKQSDRAVDSTSSASPSAAPGRLEVDMVGRGDLGVDPGADAELLLDLLLDLVREVRVVAQERPRVLLALTQLVALVGVPGAGLADEPLLDAHVDQAALTADSLAVEDVELRLLERRRHLVLDHLHAGAVADRLRAVLERLDAAHVEPNRGVELQRAAARRRLRAAEDDADLRPQLVDEDGGRARAAERTSDLP